MSGRYHPVWDLIAAITGLPVEFYLASSRSSRSSQLIAAQMDLPNCYRQKCILLPCYWQLHNYAAHVPAHQQS